jgi:hypothetical protein
MLSKIKSASLVLILVIFLTVPATVAASSGAALSIAGATYAPGSNFIVDLYEDSGATPINVASASLSFDPSKVSAISVEPDSDLADVTPPIISGNTVTIARFATAPPFKLTGKVKLASIDFKAIAGTTATTMSTTGTPLLLSGQDNLWDGQSASGTFNFAQAAPVSTKTAPPTARRTIKQPAPATAGSAKPEVLASSTTQPPAKARSTTVIASSTVPLDEEPTAALVRILVASVMAAVVMIAMYYDAHVKFMRYAKARSAHKKMLINARLKVKRG